jgi:hypothetical protein
MPGIPIARIQPAPWFRHALSVDELVRLLESRVRALECARDSRAAFCALRHAQLDRIRGLLDSGGLGAAGAWVERLELEHVHQYLRAADSWDRGQPALTAAPWRAIFAYERGHGASQALSMQIGTIAHLTYDLPLALARTGMATTDGVATAAAYRALSESYATMIDEAVRAVTARGRRGRGVRDEAPITDAWQRELRAQAWDDAVVLSLGGEREREVAFKRIELAAMCEIRRLIADAR